MNFPQNIEDSLVMTVNQIEVSPTTFEFTYTVDNQSAHDVYLINALFYFHDTDLQVDPNLIYVKLDNNQTLHLCKQFMAIPDHLKVESPEIPLAIRVASGETFSESLQLPIPIAPHDPYQLQSSAPTPSTASQFIFSLGYVIADQPMPIQQVTIPSGDEFSYVEYTSLYEHQRLKVSEPIKVSVPTTALFATN